MSQALETTGGALTVTADQVDWTAGQLAALRQLGLEDAQPADLQVFLHVAQRSGLDPFARQIYMIGRRQKKFDPRTRQESWETKQTIQTGIDGFRLIADRTGKYEGQTEPEWCGEDGVWRNVWLDRQPPAAARVGVFKEKFRGPIYAVAVFREYAGTTAQGGLTKMWESKPSIMIAKCAEALALRKAFPQDLSGLYTAEEMAQADAGERVNLAAVPDARVIDAAPPVALPDTFAADLQQAEQGGDFAALTTLAAAARDSGDMTAVAKVRAAWRRAAAAHPDKLAAQETPETPAASTVVEAVAG